MTGSTAIERREPGQNCLGIFDYKWQEKEILQLVDISWYIECYMLNNAFGRKQELREPAEM